MRFFGPTLAVAALACSSCALPRAPQPTDVAITQQRRAAAENEHIADTTAARYDPQATARTSGCATAPPGEEANVLCWSSEVNPTEEYLKKAQHYRALAAKQRAESEQLRKAEAKACAGVSELDRAQSPFFHPEEVATVTPLRVKDGPVELVGAVIAFQAAREMTEPRLERIVSCHLARNACLDSGRKDVANCPLVLENVWTSVTITRSGLFAISLRSPDPEVAREILRRSEALVLR
jgi:hypothetical protein